MDIFPLIVLTILVTKLTDYAKSLATTELTSKSLIPVSMLIGIMVTLAAGLSPAIAPHIGLFGSVTLAQADLFAQMLYGAVLGASGGVLHDLKRGGSDG